MAQWVDKDALKEALAQFVVRGDSRWAGRSEAVTIETVRETVREVAAQEMGAEALTEEDLMEVIGIIDGS